MMVPMTTRRIELDARNRLVIYSPPSDANLLRALPDRNAWSQKLRAWVASPSRVNLDYLHSTFIGAEWSGDALLLYINTCVAALPPTRIDAADTVFADPPPYPHQREAYEKSRDATAYALLMEQRTGKSRVAVDTAAYHFKRGAIDFALVVCPNSVKSVWVEDEIPSWTPPGMTSRPVLYRSGEKKELELLLKEPRPAGELTWLVVNCDAFSTSASFEWLKRVLKGRKTIAFIDEASRFKSPGSRRSKNLLTIRNLFVYRRIMTGTLITQGPLDAYVPFYFLDPAILGYSSFYAFRNAFAILGGFNGKQVIDYVNVAKLADLIAPFSYRKLRRDCKAMPERVFEKRVVEMSPQQRALYESMRDQMIAELTNATEEYTYFDERGVEQTGTRPAVITTTMILTQWLRLQQIVGGFAKLADGRDVAIEGGNPKLDALLETLEEEQGKCVIWARFRPEIELIASALRKRYGDDAVVEFHGGIREDDRKIARQRFQDREDTCRWFVGQQQTGGMGIRLDTAAAMHYFSNTFSLEDREQTGDRGESFDREEAMSVVDYVMKGTIDVRIIGSLRGKKKLAIAVNRDNISDWL